MCCICHTCRDTARRTVLNVLDSVRGKKALIIETSFAGSLGLITDVQMLKEHGIES